MATRLYSFYELYSIGTDKDVFEIADSKLSTYNGERFQIKEHGNGKVLKKLGTYHNDNLNSLVVPHAGYTGALYKKITDEYREITIFEAIHNMKRKAKGLVNTTTFYKCGNSFYELREDTDLEEDLDLCDIEDLLDMKFYIKK